MSEARFFNARGPVSVAEIAARLEVEPPAAFRDRVIVGLAELAAAEAGEATFCADRKHAAALAATRAGLCLVPQGLAALAPPDVATLAVADPQRSFVALAAWLYPDALRPRSDFATTGISPAAHVHPSARLEAEVVVDPGAVIGPDAAVGARTLVRANAVIGPGVQIGRDCVIGATSVVANALIGDRVVLHPGVKIGQDGFGYLPTKAGFTKVPQLGRVIVQNDVEIGAGTTVDRGALRDTVIGEGTKLDNLVQIAHNVVIGRHCVLAAMVGVSGSCTIGDFVAIGGNAGIADHRTIASGAQIGAKAGVMNDLGPGRWIGAPAWPEREFFRAIAALRGLARRKPGGRDQAE